MSILWCWSQRGRKRPANPYARAFGILHHKTSEPVSFKLWDDEHESIGILEVIIALGGGLSIKITVHAVEDDIPLWIDMEVLHDHDLVLDFGMLCVTK